MHETMKKYPTAEITTTGHSLGAYANMHMLHNDPEIKKILEIFKNLFFIWVPRFIFFSFFPIFSAKIFWTGIF